MSSSEMPGPEVAPGGPTPNEPDRGDALAGRLALVPLAVFTVYHAVEMSRAVEGREAWVAGAASGWGRALLGLIIVVAPLLVHGALALRRRRLAGFDESFGGAGHRRLQALSGAVVGAFVLAHAVHLTLPALMGLDGVGLYERLREDVPRPAWIGAYALASAALALHLGQGLGALVRRRVHGPVSQGLVWIVAIALFAAQAHVLGHFASGRALFDGPEAHASEDAS
ncbi:MAG: hypothetical protein AAGH15_23020 [Myxococcota bacterium]